MTPFNGVLSSCDMLARNSDFTLAASWALFLAISSSTFCISSCSSVSLKSLFKTKSQEIKYEREAWDSTPELHVSFFVPASRCANYYHHTLGLLSSRSDVDFTSSGPLSMSIIRMSGVYRVYQQCTTCFNKYWYTGNPYFYWAFSKKA